MAGNGCALHSGVSNRTKIWFYWKHIFHAESALRSESESGAALAQLPDRVDLKSDGIQVVLKLPIQASEEDDGAHPTHLVLARFIPMQMKRRGVEMRLVLEDDTLAGAWTLRS